MKNIIGLDEIEPLTVNHNFNADLMDAIFGKQIKPLKSPWTPDQVQQAIIDGLKAGEATTKDPLSCMGYGSCMPDVVQEHNGHVVSSGSVEKIDLSNLKPSSSHFVESHHIDLFYDVMVWMGFIENEDRHFFLAIINYKAKGFTRLDEKMWNKIRTNYYADETRQAPERMRARYNKILQCLTDTLNEKRYPKRAEA